MDDEQLAGLASQGDRDALAVLVQRYEAWIYTIAYKIALREQDAREITQDVAGKLVTAIRSYQAPGNFRAWLAVLTTRAAFDFLRQRRKREPPGEAALFEAVKELCPDPAPNPREALERLALREHMEKAMKYLTPQQRIILTLRLEEDLPAKDIAARLGIAPKQVRVQLSRVYARLRTLLVDVAQHYFPVRKNHERDTL
ncbi:MAG TPA: sigma-70 family RNA polymerase sigma factor [bacterium]|nr:sigma-70 family RNA polymerase sigma factor [bacterium]